MDMFKKVSFPFLIACLALSVKPTAFSRSLSAIQPDTVMITFNDFADLSTWQLNNDAHGAVDSRQRRVLRLTDSEPTQSGSAFITQAVLLVRL